MDVCAVAVAVHNLCMANKKSVSNHVMQQPKTMTNIFYDLIGIAAVFDSNFVVRFSVFVFFSVLIVCLLAFRYIMCA